MRDLTFGLLAAAALGCLPIGPSTARAADLDYDVLRGADEDLPAPLVDWSGFYVGAHGGYTSGAYGQRDVYQSFLADYFRLRDVESEFTVSKLIAIPSTNATGVSYGGFAGYNFQFDDIVLGVEADYTHFGELASSSGRIGRLFTTKEGIEEVVRLDGNSTTQIENYGSVRGRAGVALGNFLPFVTGGVALGQARINDTIAVQNYGYDGKAYAANQALTAGSPPSYVYNHGYAAFNPSYPGVSTSPAGQVQTTPLAPVSYTVAARNKTIGGVAVGAGLEYAVTSNILLRGEYQYVLFQDFNGHKAELNTARGGVAVKF